jgi:hypothetical protein
MKITGSFSILFIFPRLVFTTNHNIGTISFMHSDPPLDNPTRTLSFSKDQDSYRSEWIAAGGGDVTISLSRYAAGNQIRLWNCGVEDLKYCLKNCHTGKWSSVIEFEGGDNHYVASEINQVEMKVRTK